MAVTAAPSTSALVPSHLDRAGHRGALHLQRASRTSDLSLAFTWRWWRLASCCAADRDDPRLPGLLSRSASTRRTRSRLATKLIELTTLGLVLVPVRGRGCRRDRAPYWALIASGLPTLTLLSGTRRSGSSICRGLTRSTCTPAPSCSRPTTWPPRSSRPRPRSSTTETKPAIQPYQDWHRAWAAGYRPGGSTDAAVDALDEPGLRQGRLRAGSAAPAGPRLREHATRPRAARGDVPDEAHRCSSVRTRAVRSPRGTSTRTSASRRSASSSA